LAFFYGFFKNFSNFADSRPKIEKDNYYIFY